MAENGQSRVPLTGKAVYDTDLYGGSSPDRYAAEGEQDEREQAVARCDGGHVLPWQQAHCVFLHVAHGFLKCIPHSKLQSYTAPKNLVLPEQDAGDDEV